MIIPAKAAILLLLKVSGDSGGEPTLLGEFTILFIGDNWESMLSAVLYS